MKDKDRCKDCIRDQVWEWYISDTNIHISSLEAKRCKPHLIVYLINELDAIDRQEVIEQAAKTLPDGTAVIFNPAQLKQGAKSFNQALERDAIMGRLDILEERFNRLYAATKTQDEQITRLFDRR